MVQVWSLAAAFCATVQSLLLTTTFWALPCASVYAKLKPEKVNWSTGLSQRVTLSTPLRLVPLAGVNSLEMATRESSKLFHCYHYCPLKMDGVKN